MKIKLSKNLMELISEEIYKQLKERLEGTDEIDYDIQGISVGITTQYYLEIEIEE